MHESAQKVNGRILISLRFVPGNIGHKVDWGGKQQKSESRSLKVEVI